MALRDPEGRLADQMALTNLEVQMGMKDPADRLAVQMVQTLLVSGV